MACSRIKNFSQFFCSLCLAVSLILSFAACSLFEANDTGSVTFRIDGKMAEKITEASSRSARSARAADDTALPQTEGLFMEVSLTGGYTASKTLPVTKGATVVFDDIPVGARVSATASAYKTVQGEPSDDTDTQKIILYTGTSEEIKIKEGKNYLSLFMEHALASYTVRHFLQNIEDDGYTESASDAETLSGKISTQTEVVAKAFTGFTAQDFDQKAITANGSTEISIYYNRNVHTVRYVSGLDSESAGEEITLPEEKSYRYGQAVQIDFAAAMREGYAVAGFTSGEETFTSGGTKTFVMPDSDVTLTAVWVGATVGTVTVTFDAESSDISVAQSDSGNGTVTLTADAGFDSYNWTFDGLSSDDSDFCILGESENVLIVNTADLGEGSYDVVLTATKGEETYSAFISIKKN